MNVHIHNVCQYMVLDVRDKYNYYDTNHIRFESTCAIFADAQLHALRLTVIFYRNYMS